LKNLSYEDRSEVNFGLETYTKYMIIY